jgi:hypothetical protein
MTKRFPYIILFTSIALAMSAAYYSVFGLSKLFSSQFIAVTILAGTLETSKLITASYLHRAWDTLSNFIRIYLITAVCILMCITSLGIYGFLVSAYQETAYKFENLENLVKNYQTKQSRFETQLTATTNEKQSVTQNVQQLTAALSSNRIQYTDRNGNQIIKTSNENRKAYERQLEYSTTHLNELTQRESALSDSITAIEMKITDLQTSSDVAAEIGPLKYISKITGKTMDTIVNWLIIALIIVFDPLAIMLLIVANKELNTNNTNTITQNIEVTEQVIKPEPPLTKKSEPQILSYWNRLRNERNAKYKK